jgi:hypothetical protein
MKPSFYPLFGKLKVLAMHKKITKEALDDLVKIDGAKLYVLSLSSITQDHYHKTFTILPSSPTII